MATVLLLLLLVVRRWKGRRNRKVKKGTKMELGEGDRGRYGRGREKLKEREKRAE